MQAKSFTAEQPPLGCVEYPERGRGFACSLTKRRTIRTDLIEECSNLIACRQVARCMAGDRCGPGFGAELGK